MLPSALGEREGSSLDKAVTWETSLKAALNTVNHNNGTECSIK